MPGVCGISKPLRFLGFGEDQEPVARMSRAEIPPRHCRCFEGGTGGAILPSREIHRFAPRQNQLLPLSKPVSRGERALTQGKRDLAAVRPHPAARRHPACFSQDLPPQCRKRMCRARVRDWPLQHAAAMERSEYLCDCPVPETE